MFSYRFSCSENVFPFEVDPDFFFFFFGTDI